MSKNKILQIRVEPELAKKLQSMADADNRKLSDFVRVQLIKLTEQQKKR